MGLMIIRLTFFFLTITKTISKFQDSAAQSVHENFLKLINK